MSRVPALAVSTGDTAGVAESDPELYAAIEGELGRQRDQIELIASENIVSKAVLQAMGSVLTNKYAEGYPGRRYYGGCQYVDVAEELAIDRARRKHAVSRAIFAALKHPLLDVGMARGMQALRSEMLAMNRMVTLSLLQHQSASQRLRAVSLSHRGTPDTEVVGALLDVINQDDSVNVRLAALDVLAGMLPRFIASIDWIM